MKIVILIYSILKLYLILNIYQQAHYHIKSYFKHFVFNFAFYDFIPLILLIIYDYCNILFFKVIICILLICYSILYLFSRVKLKITKRIIIIVLICSLYFIGLFNIPIINNYLFLLIEFTAIPILFLEQAISNLNNIRYIKQAQNKLFSYLGNIIAITGSAGKTSTKYFLNQALNLYSKSICSPKSFNTPLGISKFLNDINIDIYDNLVLEFGISRVNDMLKLKRLVPPTVAFITDIGYMHMDGFKNIDILIKEKLSILNGTYKAVVNYDVDFIRDNINYNGILITYGFKYGDYNAKNICNGCFDVYYKGQYLNTFKCKLLGEYQILNLLGIIAYMHSEGYDLSILKRGILLFSGVENRLEIKKSNNITIIDDSYNSNYKGFISALNILKTYKNTKILITPGIVELGKYKKNIYKLLVKNIVDSCDIVILTGYFQTRLLYKYLKRYSIEIYVMKDFNDGFKFFKEISKRYKECCLLIENDTPDLYRIGLGL